MRIARIGSAGQEKAAVVSADEYILVDSLIDDWSRESLEDSAMARIQLLKREVRTMPNLVEAYMKCSLLLALE